MKIATKIFIILIIFNISISYGQIEEYSYKRELKGMSEQWCKIVLPNEVFGKVLPDLADIRIFGVTTDNDTVEVPYILRFACDETIVKDIAFNVINTSENDKGFYFTFENPAKEPINQIDLNFRQDNFDWRVKLEGSQEMSEWFTVIEDYRILSVKNEITNFQFCKLMFPDSKFRYFRLSINSKEKPDLISASVVQRDVKNGVDVNYRIKKLTKTDNRKTKQTEFDVELQMPLPIASLKINIKDSIDFCRPISVKFLKDSVKTADGWKYNYGVMTHGMINSLSENEFKFSNEIVQKIKILIDNQDNPPLTVGALTVKGHECELLARFTKQASYFLVYGKSTAIRPSYDVSHFEEKIPVILKTVDVGDELMNKKEQISETAPLFKNKIWLWGILIVTIIVLGCFAIKMMRTEE